MTIEDAHSIRAGHRMSPDAITAQLARIEATVRDTNGRVREIELWRARMQGVAAASRVLWMISGGTITAIVIAIATRGTA